MLNTIKYVSSYCQETYNHSKNIASAQTNIIEFTQLFRINKIIYPSGGKTVYTYNKASIYYDNRANYRDRYKVVEKKSVDSGGAQSERTQYVYGNAREGQRYSDRPSTHTSNTIITRKGDSTVDDFVRIEIFDRKDWHVETQTSTHNTVEKNRYQYIAMNGGYKKIAEEKNAKSKSGSPNNEVSVTIDRNYDTYGNVTYEVICDDAYYDGVGKLISQTNLGNGIVQQVIEEVGSRYEYNEFQERGTEWKYKYKITQKIDTNDNNKVIDRDITTLGGVIRRTRHDFSGPNKRLSTELRGIAQWIDLDAAKVYLLYL